MSLKKQLGFIKFLLMGNVKPHFFIMHVHLNQSIMISKIHFWIPQLVPIDHYFCLQPESISSILANKSWPKSTTGGNTIKLAGLDQFQARCKFGNCTFAASTKRLSLSHAPRSVPMLENITET